MLSGMAEGSFAAWAVFGSPLTLLPPMFLGPAVTWIGVGALVAAKRAKVARLVVALHYLGAPLAVYRSLRSPGDWTEDWRRLRMTCADDGWVCFVLVVPYLAGQIATWSVIRRQRT